MELMQHGFRAMGSPCRVHLYLDEAAVGRNVMNAVVAEVLRLEKKYSRYRQDSLAAQIMAAAQTGAAIELDAEAAGLLDYADTLFRETDGLFDITSGVLRRVWDFSRGNLPSQADIDAILPGIGWHKVHWCNPVLSFPVAGMEVDFGGYVKEYAADSAAAVALSLGVKHGLIELGGDIRVIGPHPDGSPWKVGVRDPNKPEAALARLDLGRGAVASSGDYERAIVYNGKRYGHILNPHTGWPVSGLTAVTVVAEHCLLAGTACTVAMLKGEHGAHWLQQLGMDWIALNDQGQILGNLHSAQASEA